MLNVERSNHLNLINKCILELVDFLEDDVDDICPRSHWSSQINSSYLVFFLV